MKCYYGNTKYCTSRNHSRIQKCLGHSLHRLQYDNLQAVVILATISNGSTMVQQCVNNVSYVHHKKVKGHQHGVLCQSWLNSLYIWLWPDLSWVPGLGTNRNRLALRLRLTCYTSLMNDKLPHYVIMTEDLRVYQPATLKDWSLATTPDGKYNCLHYSISHFTRVLCKERKAFLSFLS